MQKKAAVDEAVAAAARETIEQAKGVVMLVYSVDAEQAFTILRAASQDTNVKVREIATSVVAELPDLGITPDLKSVREALEDLLFGTRADTPRK